jgi:hypothetical protein
MVNAAAPRVVLPTNSLRDIPPAFAFLLLIFMEIKV